jgi:hypothetical protein
LRRARTCRGIAPRTPWRAITITTAHASAASARRPQIKSPPPGGACDFAHVREPAHNSFARLK